MTPTPEEIRTELTAGEQVLWSGRPAQGLMLRRSDAFTIPFSLLWCGFAIFWEASVVGSGAPLVMRLWGVPFVLAGLYLVFGRFFYDAYQRARTWYAVTTERALIVSGRGARDVKSLALKGLSEVTLERGASGQGTITFGPLPPFAASFGGVQGWPGGDKRLPPRFELIDDAKSVYELLRKAQKDA